jgi:diguanylate cyclase (GGDEF)-like protein/PAS domain S-box-containing protein
MSEKPTYEELEQIIDELKNVVSENKQGQKDLEISLSRLQTTLDSTADGVLVVDRDGHIVFFSKQFAKMWKIPESVLKSKDDDKALAFVLDQLKDPEGFLSKVKELYAHPEAESFDTLEFKDQRIFERYSRPHILNNDVIGRVWSFRDVTRRKLVEEALQESENKYRSMMEATLDAIYICSPNFEIEYMNSAMIRQVGRNATGESCFNAIHGMKEKCSWCKQHRVQQGEHYEQIIINPIDNHFYHVSDSPIIHNDGSISKMAVFRDITELKRSEKMLKDSENKFKSFAEQSLVGVNLIQEGVFKYVNPKFAEMFGYTVEECLDDMHFRKLVYPEDLPIVEEQVKKRVEGEVKSVQYTFRGLKKSGEIINVEIYGSTILIEDQPFVIATILDITERKKIEVELEQAKKEALEMANKDALTGLLNRRAFMERMEQETQRSLRAGAPLSFLLIDIDHFKDVNDRYGHQVGDLVLKRFSNQLMKSIRPYDLLGRYGGEEFVICLLGADGLQAVSIAEKMRQQIEEMIIILPDSLQSVRITASFGTAAYEMESRENVESLIKRADDALYRAKKEGRNRVCNAAER